MNKLNREFNFYETITCRELLIGAVIQVDKGGTHKTKFVTFSDIFLPLKKALYISSQDTF